MCPKFEKQNVSTKASDRNTGKLCTFLIIIIIKIQYTKQNQYNNKTFIMFIDKETQYDTKCQCDENKKYNKKNINFIWIYIPFIH